MSESSAGHLSIVATPIGNLEDITLRALRVLGEADLILAEDTRHTRKLCAHHGISTRLRALHGHSDGRTLQRCLEDLARGLHLALVSDAGSPVVSDPGGALAKLASEAGFRVEALPGPSAVTSALAVSGLDFDSFRFVGFLPRSGRKRASALEQLATSADACVLFEAPGRLVKTLRDLGEHMPQRRIAVCRELTKLHEEVVRGTPAELIEHFDAPVRGELSLVLEKSAPTNEAPDDATVDARIRQQLQRGQSPRDVASAVAEELGLPRRHVYARVQALREDP